MKIVLENIFKNKNTMSDRANQTIQSIQHAIINDDLEFLRKLLATLPLAKLDKSISDGFLFRFLSIAGVYEKREAAKILFEFWEFPAASFSNSQHNRGPLSVYVSLYLDPRYNPELLTFCNRALDTFTLVDCISELIELDDDPNLTVACHKLITVYGTPTLNTYKNLAESVINKNNIIHQFIINQIKEINDYAPVPEYLIIGDMIPRESEVVIPESPEVYFELPDDDEMVDLLLGGMKEYGYSYDQIEEATQLLRKKLSIMTLTDKQLILKPVYELKFSQEVLQKDRVLFTLLGPSNPYYGATREEMKYGGARMLLSGSFDFDPDDDYQEEPHEWFHPYCDFCSLRIRRKWHALRMPVEHGGWRGCYCSFECIEKMLDQSPDNEVVTYLLLDIFKQQIYNIGILDRIPDDEYPLYLEGKLELSRMNEKDQKYFSTMYKPKILDESERQKEIDLDNLPVNQLDYKLLSDVVQKDASIEILNSEEKYLELIQTSSIKPVIIYFYRDHCDACNIIKPYFQVHAANNANYLFAQFNVNQARLRKLAKELKINAVPLFIKYQNMAEVGRVLGADYNQLAQLIEG